MSSTLSDQLSTLGVRLLTSVLRTGFSLHPDGSSFAQAVDIFQRWAGDKARAFDYEIDWAKREDKFSEGDFRLDYVSDDVALAILLEHPDPGQPERIWIAEIAIEAQQDAPKFSTRLGFRQPRTIAAPEPRAPRYLPQVVKQVGAFDQRWLQPDLEIVTEEMFPAFLQLLLDPRRELPIIAISKDEDVEWNYAPEKLDQFLCGIAHVFLLEPGASWALTSNCDELARIHGAPSAGKMYSVYGGAIRCYLPGFTFRDSPFDHPLWLPESIVRANTRPNGFLNLCLSHTFAAAAAHFEVAPLLTPAALRRRLQAQNRPPVPIPSFEPPAPERAVEVAQTTEPASPEIQTVLYQAPLATIEEAIVGITGSSEIGAEDETPELTVSLDISALTARLEELEHQSQLQGMEINRLHEQFSALEAAKNSSDAELLQALGENEQLDSQVEELTSRFSAVNQENSELRKKVGELETYKDLCEDMGKRIEVFEGKYAGKGEDSFTRMWQSLSAFVTATQQAATSFDKYRDEAHAKAQLEQDNEGLRQELHSLRIQAEGLRRRQAPEARPRVELVLKDADVLEEFMNDHELRAVVKVMTSGRKDYRKHPMKDIDRVKQVLTILRDVYLPMKCSTDIEEQSRWADRFKAELESAHLENGPTAGERVTNTFGDHNVKVYEEGKLLRTLPCYKIRDSATNFNRQFFFIVNFAWDEEASTLYIKSFDHGPTPSDRT